MNSDTFETIKLLQNLSNSLIGNKTIYDPDYIKSVKERLPKIEKAFIELKRFLENEDK